MKRWGAYVGIMQLDGTFQRAPAMVVTVQGQQWNAEYRLLQRLEYDIGLALRGTPNPGREALVIALQDIGVTVYTRADGTLCLRRGYSP